LLKSNLIIAMTFVVGFILSALPLPETIVDWRPCWLAMLLIYWCMALPERVGILSAWLLGLLFDVQQSFILGQHALGFIFLAYVIIKNHKRMRVYPLLQQSLVVCLYLLIFQAIMLLVMLLSGTITYTWLYWLPAFTSMLIWPWLFIFMRDFRRRNNIA
jgi:rod shape-determining protein MreD